MEEKGIWLVVALRGSPTCCTPAPLASPQAAVTVKCFVSAGLLSGAGLVGPQEFPVSGVPKSREQKINLNPAVRGDCEGRL